MNKTSRRRFFTLTALGAAATLAPHSRLEAAAETGERAEGGTGGDDRCAELRQRVDHLECEPRPPFLGLLVILDSPGDRDARVGRHASDRDPARRRAAGRLAARDMRLPRKQPFEVVHEP